MKLNQKFEMQSNDSQAMPRIFNNQLITMMKAVAMMLQSYKLLESFEVQKSFKIFIIFIKILRQVNTREDKIIYTETEQNIYQQKLQYIQQIKEKKNDNQEKLTENLVQNYELKNQKQQTEIPPKQELQLSDVQLKNLKDRIKIISMRYMRLLDSYQLNQKPELRNKIDLATNLVTQFNLVKIETQVLWKIEDWNKFDKLLDTKIQEIDYLQIELDQQQGKNRQNRKRKH